MVYPGAKTRKEYLQGVSTEVESDMNILQQSAFDIDLNIDSDWCNWFAGWIDGEGCFTSRVDTHPRPDRLHTGLGITCRLAVCVRDDDSKLVYSVMDILHCGVAHRRAGHTRKNYPNQNPQIQWACEDIGACRHILMPLFDKYPLRSKKQRDYEIWRELVIAVSGGHHLNGNRDYVLELCKKLKDIKNYIPPTL